MVWYIEFKLFAWSTYLLYMSVKCLPHVTFHRRIPLSYSTASHCLQCDAT